MKDVLKNIKFIDKLMKTSSGGVLSKDVLKSFAKSTEKYLCGNLFFKVQTGNLKLSETVTGDVQWLKMFLKNSHFSQESLFIKVAALRACNFIKKASDTGACLGPLSCEQLFWTTILNNYFSKNNYFEEHLWTTASKLI